MAILDIEFEWRVAAAGYVVRERTAHNSLLAAPGKPGPSFIMTEIVPRGAATRRLTPLAINRELYLRFSEIEDRPEAFADFASAWGLLTSHGQETRAESVHTWSGHLKHLKHAVTLADRDPDQLVGFEPEGAGTWIEPGLVARLVRTGQLRPSLRLKPRSLIHALWLQLYEAVALGTEIKGCARCGRWFERGPGTERGRKARFCSDACRFGFHNERRNKGGSP